MHKHDDDYGTMRKMNNATLIPAILGIARQAGDKILSVYHRQNFTIQQKADQSPLTEADLLSHQTLLEGLTQLTPSIPILSEESAHVSFQERMQWQRYWLLDPLDGTKEFIEKNDEFTVNIALIEQGQPVLGVIYIPALALCYFASIDDGAFKQIAMQKPERIHTRKKEEGKLVVIASRRHGFQELTPFLKQLGEYTILHKGSALKCCWVAEGKADIYPRFAPTSEWDTAAAQCILEQAGGTIQNFSGQPLRYNQRESLENPFFLAVGDPHYDWLSYL